MTMATEGKKIGSGILSTSWAQELIVCDLCNSPASRFCNNCQVDLCINCVNKHVDDLETLLHEIAPYKNRTFQLIFPKCESHADRRCEAYCKHCQTPVCSKCIIGPHKSHDAEDVVTFVESKKQDINKQTKEMEEKLIPTYKTNSLDIQNQISKATAEYTRLEQENETLRKIWHLEVDDIFDRAGSIIFSMRENDLRTLTTKQARVKNLCLEITQTINKNKEILNSNKVSEVTNYTYNLTSKQENEIRLNLDFDIKIPSLLTRTLQGRELGIEISDVKATLTRIPPLKKATVIATIPTYSKPLCKVVCVGLEKCWISSNMDILTKVDIRGIEYPQDHIVTYKHTRPLDITMSTQGELVYSDSKSVKIVRQGNIEKLVTTPQGWEPRGVCFSRSGDILVSVNSATNLNKIIRYKGNEITQEIDKDEQGNPIFAEGEYMLFVTENNNGDICVSDGNADKVVVVDKNGRVRFQYDGTPARLEESFDPRCIQTDKHSHIIMTDLSNDCLHILDQNGNFLGCVDDCELDTPQGLSVDSGGRLWVGLFRAGQIKVIEYLK